MDACDYDAGTFEERALRARRLDQPGDLAVVLRVLELIYTAGDAGRVDLAGEAIRLARQLTLATEEPEAHGLLAVMLLNHARLPGRLDPEGRIVALDRQDRGLWGHPQDRRGRRLAGRRRARSPNLTSSFVLCEPLQSGPLATRIRALCSRSCPEVTSSALAAARDRRRRSGWDEDSGE
jgi:hypothetical protein